MRIKDSKQIRKKLEEEYNENCSKIDDLNEKIRALNANDFETKANCVMGFSILPWIASILVMPGIIKSGIIPLNLVQPLFVGIPALIGITAEELFTRKSNCRERLRKFSNSKTQKEKIEESTKYEIEKEKLRSANKILKKIYDDLLANENLINSHSISYNITEKDVDERTKEEIDDSIKNINNILQKKQQEVDVATTKNVLKEKFWKVRDKFNRFSDILTFGMIGGMMFMLYNMPIMMYLNQLENIQFQTSFLGALAPAIIGGIVCGCYGIKRRNNFTSAFKTINNELGDNAISEFNDYEKEKQIDKNLENIIRDTCAIKLQLEIEKQKLENLSSIFNSESVMNNFMKKLSDDSLTCDKEPTTEKELVMNEEFINVQLENYKKLLESPIMQEIEEPRVEGPRLVKKMTPENDKK